MMLTSTQQPEHMHLSQPAIWINSSNVITTMSQVFIYHATQPTAATSPVLQVTYKLSDYGFNPTYDIYVL